MTKSQAERIIEELTLLREEVARQTEAARETEALLLALAGPQPKQTAMEYIRSEGISMFGEVN